MLKFLIKNVLIVAKCNVNSDKVRWLSENMGGINSSKV